MTDGDPARPLYGSPAFPLTGPHEWQAENETLKDLLRRVQWCMPIDRGPTLYSNHGTCPICAKEWHHDEKCALAAAIKTVL